MRERDSVCALERGKGRQSVFLCVRRRVRMGERVKSLIPGIEDGKLGQCEERDAHTHIHTHKWFCTDQQCPLCTNQGTVSSI